MNANIFADRERKINTMIEWTGCSRAEAISYLMSEKWMLHDAVLYYKMDNAQG